MSANAERAADDASTIAYLGELDYGASAVSLPITNEARILQVSPTDGLTSLTRTPPGRPRSNPVRLRPAERRSFVRLTPTDLLQAERLLELMRADGVRRMAVLFDQEVYGRELAAQLIARARRDGPEPVGDEEYRGDVKEIPGIARNLAEGAPTRWSTRAWPVRAPAGCSPRSTRACPACPSTGRADCSRATRVCRSRPRRRACAHSAPCCRTASSARARAGVVERVEALHGRAVARPEAVYGYEAMRLVLDAVAEGGRDRERVIDAAMRIRDRTSPLGVLRIRATGDVEESRFALYALSDGSFRFVRVVREAGPGWPDCLLVKPTGRSARPRSGCLGSRAGWSQSIRRDVLRVRWLVVLSCLLGAFALGMTACGDDDDDDGGGGGDSGGGGGRLRQRSIPRFPCRVPRGHRRPPSSMASSSPSSRPGQGGQHHRQVHLARRLDRSGRHLDA